MQEEKLQILAVEDNPADFRLISEYLKESSLSFAITHCNNLSEALKVMEKNKFVVSLLDLDLPDSRGLSIIDTISGAGPHTAIIVLTGLKDEKSGVEALQRGAQDYLAKENLQSDSLARSVRYAVERKRAEEALKKSNEELEKRVQERTKQLASERQRLYDVLEALPVYVILLTPDYHISFANKFFREHFGEDRGRSCFDYLFKRDKPCENCETYKVLKDNQPHHWEWIGPDGRNYDIYDFPFTEADGSSHIMEMGIDITDQKKAQNALLGAQKEIDRARRLSDIGTLAATVAHELRNPLAAINMAAYNIRRKAANPLLDSHLGNIEKKVVESEQIINNLLFYSRISAPRYEDVNINQLIEECAEASKQQFKSKKKVAVRKKLNLTKDISIEADPLQIKEILHNVLNNSYDAVEEAGGKIEILTENNDGFIEISIRDNGSGIDKDNLERIFEPFFTTKAKGTGLGLTVCKQIVTLHGGTIRIASQPQEGTNVSIVLPIKNGKKLNNAQ